MRYKWLIGVLVFMLFQQTGRTQEIGFGLVTGVSLAQIDGDNLSGYHNIGPYGGLKGVVPLKDEWEAELQINFVQKGTRSTANHFGYYNVTLSYLAFPLLVNYVWEESRLVFSGGLSPNYLIHGTEDRGFGKEVITEDVVKVDVTGTLAVGYQLTDHTMARVRVCNSLLSIRKSINEYWLNRSIIFAFEFML